ncbi:MAG TPA: NAD(P)H-dependent oxidoreductase [Spirochaetota bacterium]|nr:NAD(P)H-dependent oxidoreductase [Spirochaetota bacterium]
MKSGLQRIFFIVTPFLIYALYRTGSSVFKNSSSEFVIYSEVFALVAIISLIFLQLKMEEKNYFSFAVLGALVFLITAGFYKGPDTVAEPEYINDLLEFTLSRPESVLYFSFFLMASLPPVLGKETFTCYFAKPGVPEIFWGTRLFSAVNLVINYFWAVIFALSIGSQFFKEDIFAVTIPVALQLLVGAPVTVFLIPFLQKKLAFVEKGAPRDFLQSAEQAVTGMPYVFDRKAAGDLNIVIQFIITGGEEIEGYIEIKDGECSYREGVHGAPNMTMKSPADIYLKIARNEISGPDAFFKKLISIEGDFSIALKMDQIFGMSSPPVKKRTGKLFKKIRNKRDGEEEIRIVKRYFKMEPGEVKKVLLIQGSPRKAGTSKTAILADAFLEGCRKAGAETEIVNLSGMNINACTGCYTCWTRTPGKCIFNDDAAEIMRKEDEADLVVYASPLYVFGIVSTLKKYLDRKIPMLQPYLVHGKTEMTSHPVREGWRKSRNIAILGVCGFPEADNFQAVSAYFHFMANQSGLHGTRIITEIYRPASEILDNGFYSEETERVLDLARIAGEQVVKNGTVEKSVMQGISEVRIDMDSFIDLANKTWDRCISEGKTLSRIQEEFQGNNKKG